ncbi:MAG: hypothetical protein KDD76_02605, partial [Rickettsiales bacterium]|nr:hypothetical protein [Rickettsiales bacterium]
SRFLCPPNFIISDMEEKIQHRIIMRVGKRRFLSQVHIYLALESLRYPERKDEIFRIARNMLAHTEAWDMPLFPISGRDLLNMGIPAGETIGKLLDEAEIFWEHLDYKANKEELINFVKTKYSAILC